VKRRSSDPYVIRGFVNGRPLTVEIGMDFDPGDAEPEPLDTCPVCGHAACEGEGHAPSCATRGGDA
jgi:hypothetical protein